MENNEEQVHTPTEEEKANELIALQKKTRQQVEQMQILKDEIKPKVINEPLKTTSGVVSFVQGGSSKLINKDKMRDVLTKVLHLSPENAEKIIDLGSIDKIVASYVKVTPA